MRRVIKNHDHIFSDDELQMLCLILEGHKSLKELGKLGVKITSRTFYNVLMKYEFAGILLYEEPVENYALMSRYGFFCVTKNSYGENLLKELKWNGR